MRKTSKQCAAVIDKCKGLFVKKMKDYGCVWHDMRISSLTDLIILKLLHVKQIENNESKTIACEGIDTNCQDIIKYAVFTLILMGEGQTK